MSKSRLTILLSLVCILAGYTSPVGREQFLAAGFFAFSGAVTNWLAVHMLFHKVPLLYGSGVIPSRFEMFKRSVKQMMMTQFFNEENIETFLHGQADSFEGQVRQVVHGLDYHELFDNMLLGLRRHALGRALLAFGSQSGLIRWRQPAISRLQTALTALSRTPTFRSTLQASMTSSRQRTETIRQIEAMIDERLEQWNAGMVKDLLMQMMSEHLGWLVVWGGVFGAGIGLGMSFLV